MSSPFFDRLNALLAHLPFPLDAVDQVNAAFRAMREKGKKQAKDTVEVWTYCYVLRYYSVKASRDDIHPPSDLDVLVGKAFRRVTENQHTVKDPGRYASWVSVVCKNTFLNYTRKQEVLQSIDDEEQAPVLVAENAEHSYDAGFIRAALRGAIQRLPDYLQEVARLHLLRGLSYSEIAAETGRNEGTVRTYRHRILKKLREDPALTPFLDPSEDKGKT